MKKGLLMFLSLGLLLTACGGLKGNLTSNSIGEENPSSYVEPSSKDKPSKSSSNKEESYDTYENRFIYTLRVFFQQLVDRVCRGGRIQNFCGKRDGQFLRDNHSVYSRLIRNHFAS